MKRSTLLLLLAASLSFGKSKAQTIIMQEDFTSYAGTAGTVPAGWTFSNNDNYTTTASSGVSGPNSYRFSINGAVISSPSFSPADSVSFWLKGNGTDNLSTIYVRESADNINWDTIAAISSLPTNLSGQTYTYALQPATQYVSFAYFKSVGNAAFDDVRVTLNPPVTAAFTGSNVCPGTAINFQDASTSTNGSIVSWAWNFGDNGTSSFQNPTYIYTVPGTYNVQLIVTDVNNAKDTAIQSITIYPVPAANFTSALSGGTVTLTNTTPGTNTYIWSFGDNSQPGTGTNASHTYTSNGTYNVCLIAENTYGCSDTTCNSITISTIDIPELTASKSLSIYPNPSLTGVVTLDFGNYAGNNVHIKVYDIIGNTVLDKQVISNKLDKQVVDLGNKPAGSYFINVATENESFTKRILVK
jgi:PKD repeat protein